MTLKVLNKECLPISLSDPKLKNRDKGVLSTLVLNDFGEKVTIDSLIKQSADGRTTIHSALESLEKFGYLHRERERNVNGIFGSTKWTVDCLGRLG